jgi:hypothetical protein
VPLLERGKKLWVIVGELKFNKESTKFNGEGENIG